MLQEDPMRTHIPADILRIAALYEATNQPLVQPAGRTAQAAKGAVIALLEEGGFAVMVAITLTDTGENVIYSGELVGKKELQQALEEALNFAESMGFILDPSGWTNLERAQKLELLARIPSFRPPTGKVIVPAERPKPADAMAAVARLFAAFCALLMVQCSGISAEQRAQASEIHQQLGDNLLSQGDPQGAMKEYLQSLDSEESPEAHLGLGVIYTWSLGRPSEGEKEFKRALEMRPDYAEAMNNLGALYISRERFGEAIAPLQKAAHDPLYKSRVLAQSNLGWALYKAGKTEQGVSEIKGALAVAPKFCLGWRQLGTIYSEQGRIEDAGGAFGKYAEACPEQADAHLLFGKVLARQSKAQEARAEFQRCAVPRDDKEKPVASECARFLKEMGAP